MFSLLRIPLMMLKSVSCRSIVILLLLSTFALPLAAQVTTDAPSKAITARPDIPGIFTLEIGVNRGISTPSAFDIGLWGSRTLNLYYQREFRILKSKFSLVPGVGFSLERYKFRNGRILSYSASNKDSVFMATPTSLSIPNLKKTRLITNYLEVPVEIRFTANPNDPNRSFKFGVGARVGVLIEGGTKVTYTEGGETKKIKDKQNFNLNTLRYGVFAKAGVGNFAFFCNYNLSPLFKEGKGLYSDGVAQDFNTITVGISLASF